MFTRRRGVARRHLGVLATNVGAVYHGPIELPILHNNISSTTIGSIDNNDGMVTLPAATKQVTITLTHPRAG